MPYRIPSEDEVVKAMENCLARTPHIRSQSELCRLVSTELACMDENYRVSGNRLRHIGIKRGVFTVEIRYARTEKGNEGYVCPVCGGILESVRNRTLEWGTVELMRKCDVCGYSIRGTDERPAQYTMTRRVRMPIDGAERIDMLREAELKLNEAADLMDRALHMSGLEHRSGRDSDTVRMIASDPGYGGSVSNLIRELEYADEEQPCWTQPLTSPKHQFEKKL